MIIHRFSFSILIVLLVIVCFVFTDFAQTAQDVGNINIQYVVEEDSGGGIVDSTAPVISAVSSIPDYTTSTVSWIAVDNLGISSCVFTYGLTAGNYTSSSIPNVNVSNYSINLDNLSSSTPYYFLIECYDSVNNHASETGIFTTLPIAFNQNLTIIGYPEKRIQKIDGNLNLESRLLLYNEITKEEVFLLKVDLNNEGSVTVSNSDIPIGNFDAVLKGQSHLGKKIIGVVINNDSDVVLDFTDSGNFYLKAGDVQGTDLKDNEIDILDISAEDIKFNSNNLEFDLNRDGIVDVLDLSMILTNFGQVGDPV